MVETIESVIKALTDAEDALDPGIGQPNIEEGHAKLREAANALRSLKRAWLADDLFQARTEVQDWIERNL